MNKALYNACSACIASSLVLDILKRRTLIAWRSLGAMDWTLEALDVCGQQTRYDGRADLIHAACADLPEELCRMVLALGAGGL